MAARTVRPGRAKAATTARPTKPEAPVTRMRVISHPSMQRSQPRRHPLERGIGLHVAAVGLYCDTIVDDFVAVEEQGITAQAPLIAKAHAGEPSPALDGMHPAGIGDFERVVEGVVLKHVLQMGGH